MRLKILQSEEELKNFLKENEKLKLTDIASMLGVSKVTLHNYKKKYGIARKQRVKKFNDIEFFKKFLEENKNLSVREMAKKFPPNGVSTTCFYENIRRLNFRYLRGEGYRPKE